ncbi:MAG: tripartite tricarboxylate transporter TctB family protein [Paracoccaceae bacterium]|nr:tripartite tricarboxylate transporter TctB family protein [Paracoccaceae bacterium]
MNRFTTWVTLAMLAIFVTMVVIAWGYPARARFMPFVVGLPAIGLCLLQLVLDLRAARRERLGGGLPPLEDEEFGRHTTRAEIVTWIYFVLFIGAVLAFGFLVAAPVLIFVYLWREAQVRPFTAAAAAAVFTLVMHLMFERLLGFVLHPGLWPLF